MKIGYCSDIHLEMNNVSLSKFENQGADVLILAGDIITANAYKNDYLRYHDFFSYINEQYSHILYVFGNHEFYNMGQLNKVSEKIKEIVSEFSNIHILNNESIEINGQMFFGGTLWTSMNNSDPSVMFTVLRGMNDYNYILNNEGCRLLPIDTVEEHEKYLNNLNECLEKNPDKDWIVISHHSPSLSTVQPQHRDKHYDYAYCSDLSELIRNHKISHWFFGHQHQRNTFEVYDCKLHINSMGYQEYEKSYFKAFEMKFVEIANNIPIE